MLLLLIASYLWTTTKQALRGLLRACARYVAEALGDCAISGDTPLGPTMGQGSGSLADDIFDVDGPFMTSKPPQSMVTDTALRGVAAPRFQPLGERFRGVWDCQGFPLTQSSFAGGGAHDADEASVFNDASSHALSA